MGRPAGFDVRRVLMDGSLLARSLARMAHEIVERHPDMKKLVLVGIQTRGVPLAQRLARLIKEAGGSAPSVGSLDITLYRDDLSLVAPQPMMKGTSIPVSIDERTVVVTDDVLYTGRTVRAALDELIDFGRPARIELAVLVDRGHRELPIHADYIGKTVETADDEIVQVRLAEEDGEDRVLLLGPGRGAKKKAAAKKTVARRPKGAKRR